MIFKIGGMPSIPSKDNSLEDLGAGIILMRSGNKPKETKLGPGARVLLNIRRL